MTPRERNLAIIAFVLWLATSGVAMVYRDALVTRNLEIIAIVVLGLPLALAAYFILETVGQAIIEGILHFLCIAAFKIVTLGQIRTDFTSSGHNFPWYGIKRDHHGRLVAHEGCVVVTGLIVYAMIGLCCYLWYVYR